MTGLAARVLILVGMVAAFAAGITTVAARGVDEAGHLTSTGAGAAAVAFAVAVVVLSPGVLRAPLPRLGSRFAARHAGLSWPR